MEGRGEGQEGRGRKEGKGGGREGGKGEGGEGGKVTPGQDTSITFFLSKASNRRSPTATGSLKYRD